MARTSESGGLTVLISDFPNSAFRPDRTEALKLLAEGTAGQHGRLWKLWTEEPSAPMRKRTTRCTQNAWQRAA